MLRHIKHHSMITEDLHQGATCVTHHLVLTIVHQGITQVREINSSLDMVTP